jgi:hypothetical protein
MSLAPSSPSWPQLKAWALDALERAARTFIQAFGAALLLHSVAGVTLSEFKLAAFAGMTAVLSVVVSASAPAVTGSASGSYLAGGNTSAYLDRIALRRLRLDPVAVPAPGRLAGSPVVLVGHGALGARLAARQLVSSGQYGE